MGPLGRDEGSVMIGWRLVLLAALALGGAWPAGAQVVTGVVRDAATGAPLPGVVVALDVASGDTPLAETMERGTLVLAVLTNDRGEYAVRAAAAGQYIISAKRIGVRRQVSAPFALAVGETRALDLRLEGVRFSLPEVRVTESSPCALRPAESQRIAALWEEARTALYATQLSLRDRLFTANISRYARRLDRRTQAVQSEEHSEVRGVTQRPFAALAVERLAGDGYAQRQDDGSIIYYAPDADVLLSTVFLRDHCFELAAGHGAREGLVGLAFSPVARRRLPDVQGTLWLDARSYELRTLEFDFVNVEYPVEGARARGEVRFARMGSGAWIVSRWYIRMPEFGAVRNPSVPAARTLGPSRGVELVQYREEGGDVRALELGPGRRVTSLSGRVADSTGRTPLREATVRLAGTPYEVRAQSDGSFRFDSLPGGVYSLVVEQPGYRALGLFAAEQALTLEEGAAATTSVQAIGSVLVLRQVCGFDEHDGEEGSLRVVVRATGSEVPVDSAVVSARWSTYRKVGTSLSQSTVTERIATDQDGTAAFCHLPSGPVEVSVTSADGRTRIARTVRIQPRALSATVLHR
jgi:Carboxypeptidase regulatory-like domain